MNRLKCFAVLVAAMLTVSCDSMFQKKVSMPEDTSDTTTSLYDVLGMEVVTTELNKPAEIIVSMYEYNDRIKVSWSEVRNARSYRLERAIATQRNEEGELLPPEENDYEVLIHTKTLYTTSYTDVVINGTAKDPLDYTNEKYDYVYYYRVRAENERGGFEPSEFITSTKAMLLPPTKNVRASLGEYTDYIELEWDAVVGAKSYEIYRSLYVDGSSPVKLGTSTILHYSDSAASNYAGQELYYIIYAVSNSGAKSVESPLAMGYTLLPGAPTRVTGVCVTTPHGGKSIGIEWELIEANEEDDIIYTVYRSSSKDSSMQKLADITVNKGESYDGFPFKDPRTLRADTYYYYYVQAGKNDKDEEGKDIVKKGPMSQSGPDSEAPAESFIISVPTSFGVSKLLDDPANSIVKFGAPIGDKAYPASSGNHTFNDYEYIISVSDAMEGPFTQLITIKSSQLENAVNGVYSYTVPSYNYYKIKTVFSELNVDSDETEPTAPAPYAARNVYVTKGEMVGEYSDYIPNPKGGLEDSTAGNWGEPNANTNGVHPVRITWEEPDGGCEGGYYIYRSDKQNTGFTKITETPIMEFSYIDENDGAKAGVIYYYRVLSLNKLGQGANYSIVEAPKLGSDGIIARSKESGQGFGWGALTLWQYMQEQRKTVVTSQNKLTIMHKPNDLDKIGKETINGDISGTLSYDAHLDGLGAEIIMPYSNYADSYIQNDESLGIYFLFVDGNTNTKSNMSANGQMNGTITCKGMYPGKVCYDKVEIKGGKAGGGTYGVIREGIESDFAQVNWKAGN